jgi:DNA-binding CsgD family transcriptional regulator
VSNHLSLVRAKLEVSNDLQLLRLAARHGLVALADAPGM